MALNSKVKYIYDTLKNGGGNVGSEQEFNDWFFAKGKEGYHNRKYVYETLTKGGGDAGKSYEEFRDWLGLHAVKPQAQVKPQQPSATQQLQARKVQPQAKAQAKPQTATPMTATTQGGFTMPEGFGEADFSRGVQSPFLQEQERKAHAHDKQLAKQGLLGRTEEQKREASAKAQAKTVQKAIQGDEDAVAETGLDSATQQLRDRMDYYNATGKELKDDVLDLTSIGIAPTVARDENGEIMRNEDGTVIKGQVSDPVRAATQAMDSERMRVADLDRQIEEANDELLNLKKEIDKIETPGYVYSQDALSPYADPRTTNTDLASLSVAYTQLQEKLKGLQVERAGGQKGFFNGMLTAAKDPSTWLLGLDKLSNTVEMLRVSEKVKSGKELTDSEKKMLDATMANNAVQGKLSEDSDWLYRAGAMTTQMIPFALQIGFTGGFGSVAEMGATGGEKLAARYAAKYGEEALINRVNANIIRGLGVTFGDVAAGFCNAVTTGAANTAVDAMERRIGDLGVNEKGEYQFTGDDDWIRAIGKAVVSQTKEFATERFGEHLPSLREMNVWFAKQGMGARKIARALSGFAGTKAMQNTAAFLRKGGINGVGGEILEEEIGLPIDVAIGDMTWEDALSGKTQWDICGGMLLSMGAMHATGLAAQGVGKTYNTAQYYKYKNRADKSAHKAATMMGNDAWRAMQEKIDGTETQNMETVWEDIRNNESLSDKEKRAAFDYMNALTLMRGYNMGMFFSASEAAKNPALMAEVKPTTKKEQDEIDVMQSRDRGYNLETPQEQNDAKNMRDYARQQLEGHVSGELISRIDEDPLGTLEIIDNSDLSDEAKQKARDYVNAKATYDGMIQSVRDRIETETQQATEEIDSRVASEEQGGDGKIHPATMKADNRQVYIVSGNVRMLDDGSMVDRENSDKDLIVRDAETGKVEFVSIDDILRTDEVEDAEQLKQEAVQNIQETVATEASNAIDGVLSFEPNSNFTIMSDDGVEHTVQVVQDQGDGTVAVLIDGATDAVPMAKEQLQEMSEAYNMSRLQQYEAEKAVERTEEAQEQSETAEGAEEVAEGAEGIQAQETPTEEEEPMPMIGEGEDAEPDFASVTPERAHKYVYEESGLDEQTADEFVANNAKAAKTALDKAVAKKPKIGTNIAKYNKEKAQYEANVQAAQEQVDYWNGVKAQRDAVIAQRIAERAAERKAIEEREKAKAEAEEAARQAEITARQEEEQARGANTVGEQVKQKWNDAPKVEGSETEITLQNGERVKGRYMLVESGAATASHDAQNGFVRSEGFPVDESGQTVNDRDYERDKDAQNVTRSMGEAYDSRAIQDVPVVSRDGVVLSGNGRTMAGEIAAQNGTDGAYTEHLRNYGSQYGFTQEQVDGMQHPRLVFVPEGDMPYTTETFAKFNEQAMKSQSKTEKAVKMGKVVDDATYNNLVSMVSGFDSLSDFYNSPKGGAQAVNALQQAGVVNEKQMAELYDGEKLSEAGRALLESVLIGKAFEGNADMVRMLSEFPSLRRSVVQALTEIGRNKQLGNDYNVADELAEAVKLAYNARKQGYTQGQSVSAFARQLNLFPFDEGSETVADYTNATILMLADALNDARTTRLRNVMALYNKDAQASAAGQQDLFAGGVVSREDILKDVINLLNNGRKKEQQQALDEAREQRKQSATEGTQETGIAEQSDEGNGEGELANNVREQERQEKILPNLGGKYSLSQEKANNGEVFYQNEDGSTILAIIPDEIFDRLGIKPIPFKLTETMGWHVYDHHKKEAKFKNIGDAIDFVLSIVNNVDHVRLGRDNSYIFSVENGRNKIGKRAVTIMINSETGEFMGIRTSGYETIKKLEERPLLWERSADAAPEDVATSTITTIESQQGDETSSRTKGQSNVSSESKVTNNSTISQEKEQKNASETIKNAEQETNANPTEAQKEAGNYKKGHVKIDGYDITIENPKGSERSGTDASGKKWSITMQNTYGYIRGTEGVDGDHIDVFLSDDPSEGDVFVVDQVNANGTFDEHKVMYGFPDAESARKAYLSNYEEGWQGLGAITPVSKEEFKKWINSSHRKTKPFAEYSSVKPLEENKKVTEESLKQFLGDWEKDPENATKAVDKKGQPIVVYRGGGRLDNIEDASNNAMYGKAYYATPDRAGAEEFAEERTGDKNNVQAAYINVRHPFVDGDVDGFNLPSPASDKEINALVEVLAKKGLKNPKSFLWKWNNGKIYGSVLGHLASEEYEGRERPRGMFWHAGDIVQEALKELGYDGVIGMYSGMEFRYPQVAVFDMGQVMEVPNETSEQSGAAEAEEEVTTNEQPQQEEKKNKKYDFSNETEEEFAAFEKKVRDMSDEELLDVMRSQGFDETKADHPSVYDEYDYRHGKEYTEMFEMYMNGLNDGSVSREQVEEMLADAEKEWEDGGFANDLRTQLNAQIDACREWLEAHPETKDNVVAKQETGRQTEGAKEKPKEKRAKENTAEEDAEIRERINEFRKKYPDNLVFPVRHADGSATYYDNDARIVAELLGVELDGTKLTVDKEQFDKSLQKLIATGRRVGMLESDNATVELSSEQPEQKKPAEKQATKPKKDASAPKTSGARTSGKGKIDDVGERLEGARKDALKVISKSFEEATEKALTELPFAKAFKKPDLKKAVENGALREEDAQFYDAFFSLINTTKPKLTKYDSWHKSRDEDYVTPVERWVKQTHDRLTVLKGFIEASPEERDILMRKMLEDKYPTREAELAEIEKRKEWNKDYTYTDKDGKEHTKKYEWGDKTTPNPIWVAHEILARLGYQAGDKVDIPYGNIEANSSGTGYNLMNTKREGLYALSSFDSVESAIDAAVYLTRLKRGDTDLQHPRSLFDAKFTKTTYKESGKYRVLYGRNYTEKQFDSKEEAEKFAEAKKAKNVSAAVYPMQEVDKHTDYEIYFKNPLTGEKIPISSDKFATTEEAKSYLSANVEETNDAANAVLQKQAAEKGQRKEKNADDMLHVSYTYSKDGASYAVWVNKEIANNYGMPIMLREGFKTREEAQKYLDEHKAEFFELYKKQEAERKAFVYFSQGEDTRIGEDYRNGKDVTAEDFMNEFGFRGVQFGNWTNQADRQMAVNQAYDALIDLSHLLGVSPRAISLGGKLGIAFGSRGSGSANAHFEPGEFVINLTKTRGAGSLAHEWWHAMDNYFAKNAGVEQGYVTETTTLEMRQELRDAFNAMIDMVRNSDYYERSRLKGAYWGRTIEVTARLFAEWVDRELKKRGELNTFLSRGADIEKWQKMTYYVHEATSMMAGKEPMPFDEFKETKESLKGYPFPSEKEVTEMGNAVRNIFETMQERTDEETDAVELFRDEEEDNNEQVEEDDSVLMRDVDDEELIEQLEREPKVKVYRSMVLIDGKLYPPMSSKSDGKLRKPSELGKWEEAEEAPEKAKQGKNGKWYFSLKKDNGKNVDNVAYNPYIHTSTTMLNDQFMEAQSRDNLVVVEMEVPVSELTSGYRAEKAHDTTGVKQWKAGPIQGQLTGTREVILTRWAKPIRIVPTEEVAQSIAEQIDGQVRVMPSNVVTPQVREALEALGVQFVETDNKGKLTEGVNVSKTWVSVYGNKKTNKKGRTMQREGDGRVLSMSQDKNYSRKQRWELMQREWKRMQNKAKELIDILKLDRIAVYGTVEDMPEGMRNSLSERKKKAKGWYDTKTGKIVIILGNHRNAEDVAKTILHEAVAHYGLRRLFGKNFDTFLDNVYQNADVDVKMRIADMAARQRAKDSAANRARRTNEDYLRIGTEEYLAKLAEDMDFENRHESFWSKIKSLFIQMLETIGLKDYEAGELSDNELRYILWRSYKNLSSPGEYRNVFDVAEDIVMQENLGVGNYAESQGETMTEQMQAAEEKPRERNIESVNNHFNEQLMQLSEATADHIIFSLGYPSDILKAAGVEDKPMKLYGNKVIKKMKKHGFSLEGLRDLPRAVSEPIAVFNNYGKEGNRTILTELKTDNGNILVTITLGKGDIDIDFNVVSSVFGKSDSKIIDWFNKGFATYINKEKALDYLHHSAPIAEALSNPRLDSVAKVINNFENPKFSEEKVEDDELFRDAEERDRVTARDMYERMVSSGRYQFQEAVQDSMLGLKALYKAVLGKNTNMEDVPGNENAYVAENLMSSATAAEQSEYFIRYMKPLIETIHKLCGSNKKAREELTNYLMAKHGLERNRILAERDFKEYQTKHPTGTKTLADFRERDYAGLTALTEYINVSDAEAEAQRMVDAYEQAHDVTELWQNIKAANEATLTKLWLSGVLSRERYEQIRDMFEYYIPLQGFEEKTSDEVYGYLTSKNGPLMGSPIKRAKGRSSKADDPIATMGLMADKAIQQGNRNRMKICFLNFVQNHPSDLVSVNRLWLKYDDVTDEWVPMFADISPEDTAEEVEQKVEMFEQKMQALAQADPDHYKHGKEAQNIPYKVVSGNLREHQVLVKRAGETYVLTINGNPRAAQALNGLTNPDVEQNGVIGKLLGGAEYINRQLSAFYTTRNPDFVASNFLRDMIYSNCMSWAKEGANYGIRFNKNFAIYNPVRMARLYKKWENGTLNMGNKTESLFYEFMKNGGETGYTNVRDLEAHKRSIAQELKRQGNTLRAQWHALGELFDLVNRSVENTARFAAFVTSKELGRATQRAVYDAKEISVNFNKKGSGSKMLGTQGLTALGTIGAYVSGIGRLAYVFWNAGVQGTTNLGKSIKRRPKSTLTGLASMFALGYIVPTAAAILAGGGGDDDDDDKNDTDYWDLPEYVRRSNICFKVSEDNWIKIPLPIEFRAMYGLGEITAGTILGRERYSNSELAFHLGSQVSQVLPLDVLEGGGGLHAFIPSIAKPLVEAAENRSWTGMPIYRDSPFNENDPEWTKAYSNTNKTLVSAAEWLNEISGGDKYKKGAIDINPAQVEYMLNGYFGGVSSTINKLANTAEMIIGERDFDWRNVPIANRVLARGDERTEQRKIRNDYFKYKERCEETKRLLKKYEAEADNGVFEYAERLNFLNNSKDYGLYEIYDEIQPDINSIRKEMKDATDEERKGLEKEERALQKEMVLKMRALEDAK